MVNNIGLKSLFIKNFKGIRNLGINFGSTTNIYGDNGIGKTTIHDAFTFLLFDKDSSNSSKFDVQPLDKDNKPIHNLETVIEAILNIDGYDVTLKRVYKEKYSKVRGKSIEEFKGYESTYYIDEVPKKLNEYKAYISDLIDENIFKLVTNPNYFSSLPWKDRRVILTKITGDAPSEDVISHNKQLEPLAKYIISKSIDDFIKANKSKINQLKKDRQQIPSRIDEVNNSIHELDFDGLEIQKRGLVAALKSVEEKIIDKSKVDEEFYKIKNDILVKQHEVNRLRLELKSSINKPLETLQQEIRVAEYEISCAARAIKELESSNLRKRDFIDKSLKVKRESLLDKYNKTKSIIFEFDESKCICPTCKRRLDETNIEEMKKELEKNHNDNVANMIKINIQEGKSVKDQIENCESEIIDNNEQIKALNSKISIISDSLNNLRSRLSGMKQEDAIDTQEIIDLNKEISILESRMINFKQEDTSELKVKKQSLQKSIQELDSQLTLKNINEKSSKRILDLEQEEKVLNEKIAELEGLEILSEDFIRSKVELLEDKVNSNFKYVKFKMFREQINGGLEECCEPCVDGVPYSTNLNNAAKINAGIDIINTLCRHYNISAPIFVDNAEGINNMIYTESQIIRLVVSKDEELKVEVM